MYCGKCGNSLDEGQKFCDKCGQSADGTAGAPNQTYSPNVVRREKSEGAAAVLSFIWGGVGQIYVGRIGRGLGIIATYIVLMIVAMASVFGSRTLQYSHSDYWYDYYVYVYDGPLLMLGVLILIICFVFLIWNVFDAYKLARQYNDSLRATGKPPW